MGVRVPEESGQVEYAPVRALPWAAAMALALLLLLLLVANGRPIGAGDTRANERVAASLVQEGNLDLNEFPEVEPPFSTMVGERRLSIYPVLSAMMAAPVFALARAVFTLDETGSALAGKLAAALFSSLAAAILFLAVSLRASQRDAVWTALVFALGTTVWSTSQALWSHPAAVLFLCLTLLFLVLAERDPVWAGRAGLPLGLMVAARHADLVLAMVLAVGIVVRWPRRVLHLVLWCVPAALFVLWYDWVYFGSPLRHGFSGALGRFSAPWGSGHLGLLFSPGKGLFVFTPVVGAVVAGLALAFRRGERWLAGTLGLAAFAHWALVGRWNEWHGGESWGPRLLTDLLPLLFLFLPEAFERIPSLTAGLAACSIAVQALGAFAYDYRWERIHQRKEADVVAPLWDPARSPIAFYARRGVLILARPALRGDKVVVREHPIVLFGRKGSRVQFEKEEPAVSGVEPTLEDVHLQRGARVDGGRLRLEQRWAGLFLRVVPEARARRLELRMAGRGRGPLYVGERSFWSDPRWTTYQMGGAFVFRHPYHYPESGGADLIVTVGLGGGEAELAWVSLVPPREPLNPLSVPPSP